MKRISLIWKLTIAFVLVALITTGLMALFMRMTSADRLVSLLIDQQRGTLLANLNTYYSANGSWNGIDAAWPQIRQRGLPTSFPTPAATPSTDRVTRFDRRTLFGLADANGVVLIATSNQYPVGAQLGADQINAGTPVMVGGKRVGTLITSNFLLSFNPEENLFLQRTNEALMYSFLAALAIALLVGILLARTLIHPLRDMTRAAQAMAHGQLDQQVKITSRDEIGQLGEAFNWMSEKVTLSNQLRKQMTADIAHDLRTPLTVIAGYIESMRDGVLQPTPARLSLIYSEIEGLQNLVGDLRMLSQVDAGELPLHPQVLEVNGLLEHAAATFEHRASQQGVEICVEVHGEVAPVRVDEARMMQIYGNLLSNSLRYTPAGGKIALAAEMQAGQVVLSVSDSGEGIDEQELPFIFDRFHRADHSRHAEAGEAGLGLAIVKALVEAHGGQVSAESRPGEGATIRMVFPPAAA